MESCAELHKIAVLMFLLVWVVLSVILIKALLWLATSMGESSWQAAQHKNREGESESGSGSSFKWVGHEAEEAYREKHWGSYYAAAQGKKHREIREAIERDRRNRR